MNKNKGRILKVQERDGKKEEENKKPAPRRRVGKLGLLSYQK